MSSVNTNLFQQNFKINASLPIGVVPPIQQQNLLHARHPFLNGIEWPPSFVSAPSKLLSPGLGMPIPGMEHPHPTSSGNGKINEDSLPPEEREKLKIKREKNALASRKCRQNKIRQIQYWKDQSDVHERNFKVKAMECQFLKNKLQGLLAYLKAKNMDVPQQFLLESLPTSPETSVPEEPMPLDSSTSVSGSTLGSPGESLPFFNSMGMAQTIANELSIASINEHQKTIQELAVTMNGMPFKEQTQLYPVTQQSSPPGSTMTSPTSSLTSPTQQQHPARVPAPVEAQNATQALESTDIQIDETNNDEDVGDFGDRPDALSLSETALLTLGCRTTLTTPTFCTTIDTCPQRNLYNAATGVTPLVLQKIIFSPTGLSLAAARSSP